MRTNATIRTTIAAGLALAATVALPDRVQAGVRRGGGSGTISLNITWPSPGSGSSRAPSASQSQATEINTIRSELTRIAAAKRREFENSAEMAAAKEAVVRKWADFRSASDASLAPLRKSDGYKSLEGTVERLQTELDTARDDGAKRYRVATLSSDLLVARSKLRKMEADHLAADDAVTAARYDAVDATGKVTALRRDFEQGLRTDGEFRAARDRLDAARDRMLADAR